MIHRKVESVNKTIIHCAGTKTSQKFSVDACRKCHKEENGWEDIGYHYYIGLDGVLHLGRPVWYVGSHTYGKNTDSIGVCLEGGYNADGTQWEKPLQAQEFTLKILLEVLKVTIPKMTIHGHYEFSEKTCPNYNIDHLK